MLLETFHQNLVRSISCVSVKTGIYYLSELPDLVKSRRIILESIWFTLKAGENMLINDPKGELYAYTSPFAKDNGYQVVAIDFRNRIKGPITIIWKKS